MADEPRHPEGRGAKESGRTGGNEIVLDTKHRFIKAATRYSPRMDGSTRVASSNPGCSWRLRPRSSGAGAPSERFRLYGQATQNQGSKVPLTGQVREGPCPYGRVAPIDWVRRRERRFAGDQTIQGRCRPSGGSLDSVNLRQHAIWDLHRPGHAHIARGPCSAWLGLRAGPSGAL